MNLPLSAYEADLVDMAIWHFVTRHEQRPGMVMAANIEAMRDVLARVRKMVWDERRRQDQMSQEWLDNLEATRL